MRSYSEREVFSEPALLALRIATEYVEYLSDARASDEIRCHELARAVRPYLWDAWVVADGKFGIVEHSWLEMVDRHDLVILDVYSVGRFPMVQLVHASEKLGMPYVAGPYRGDIRADVLVELRRQGTSLVFFEEVAPEEPVGLLSGVRGRFERRCKELPRMPWDEVGPGLNAATVIITRRRLREMRKGRER